MSSKDDQGPPQSKILRVGVVQEGKIVEERLIRRHGDVTIGSSPRNTITAAASSLPRRTTLLRWRKGQYHLVLDRSMDGRLASGAAIRTLEQIRDGDRSIVPISPESRGKVRLGELTLLFQFVTPAPIQPRPRLAPSIRGSVWKNLNWVLVASFLAIGTVHFGFISYLRAMDIPRQLQPDMLPPLMDIPRLPPPAALDPVSLSREGEKPIEKVKPDGDRRGDRQRPGKVKPSRACDAACKARRTAKRRRWLVDQVNRAGLLAVLGHKGKGKSRALANLLGPGSPGRDVKQAMTGLSGVAVASRSGLSMALRSGRDRGPRGPVDIENLGERVIGPDRVKISGPVVERVPRPEVRQDPKTITCDLPVNDLARTIRRGLPAVRTCYRRGLKHNPKLAGKVVLRLSINTMGRVVSTAIDSDSIGDPKVTTCIRSYARRWRFSPLEEGSTDVSVPFVLRPAQ